MSIVIAAISALGAIAAAVFAYRSSSIANSALRLSQLQRDGMEANIVPYLIDAVNQQIEDREILAFAMSYTNRSDLPNTLARIDLELHYVGEAGIVSHILIPSTEKLRPGMELEKLSLLSAPFPLQPRGSASGWVVFEILTKARRGPTERYRIVATSATGERITQESFLVRRMVSESGTVTR